MNKLLEEEIKSYFAEWSEDSEYGDPVNSDGTAIGLEGCHAIARHFCDFGRKIERTIIGAEILKAQKDSLIWTDVEKILECFYAVNKDIREGSLDHIQYGSIDYYEEILRRYQGR